MPKEEKEVLKFKELVIHLVELGEKKETEKKALALFMEERVWVWKFLNGFKSSLVLERLESLIGKHELLGIIARVFVIIDYESIVRDEKDKDNV